MLKLAVVAALVVLLFLGRMELRVAGPINVLPLREIVRGHAKTPGTVAKMTYLHFCTRAAVRRAILNERQIVSSLNSA